MRNNSAYKMLRGTTLRTFVQNDIEEKLNLYDTYKNRIKWIDLLTMMIDLGIIYTFYFEHFDYINNGYVLDDQSNAIRIILLVSSLVMVLGIFLRFRFKKNSDKIIQELEQHDFGMIII
jgi:hypothetical protein